MQRPQLSRQHISSPLTVVDSDDEEGPVVEGWSIFENSTDSSSSETTLGLDAPQRRVEAEMLDAVLSTRSLPMDSKGYFMVRLEAAAALPIVAEYHSCATNEQGEVVDPVTGEVIPCHDGGRREAARVVRARSAKEAQVKLFEAEGGEGLVCSHAHACYLGRELQRAEECLKAGRSYRQD